MGGRTFRVPCNLIHNGISLQISTLPDSGAHGFAFMDTRIAKQAEKLLGVKPKPLPKPILPKGYNGVTGNAITHAIVLQIEIDGYRLSEIPFLILDLGNHDAILGDGWMDHFDVLPDLRNRKLLWRSPPEQKRSFARILRIPRASTKSLPIQAAHQLDVGRREAAFEQEDQRRRAGAAVRVNALQVSIRDPSLPLKNLSSFITNLPNEKTHNVDVAKPPRKTVTFAVKLQRENPQQISQEVANIQSKTPS